VEPSGLVRAAAGGDQGAWDALVSRYVGLVWATARSYRLEDADAADVVQTTWLRLVEHLDRLRDPAAVGSWLATTARNEALRVIRVRSREVATDELDEPSDDSPPDQALLAGERDVAVRAAFELLRERCRALLRLLAMDEPPSYEEISAALDMPIGAIGPTRSRCLEQLRRHLATAAPQVVEP
jgi:RNA polymerase sigma factor (sigma-70 family)